MRWRSEWGGESSAGGGVKDGRHWWPSACREVVVAECHRIEQGHSEGGRALECVRGVNGGEGHAWRGRAARQCWGPAWALERGGGSAARRRCARRQWRSGRAAAAQRARECALKCLHAQRGERRVRERERGERKGVEREKEMSTGFDSKIIQIFVLKLQKV